ncbi:MAG: DUF87 domain-containing protein, partial [Desulfurococcales archaeon]|nr:DUF87 domain-containing protein [Desulfurococcales archaeon]
MRVLGEDVEIPLAAVLSAMNALVLASGGSGLGIPSIVAWVAITAAGYVSARTGRLTVTLSELLSLGMISILTYSWVSAEFIMQELGVIAALFFIGWFLGLTVGGRGFHSPRLEKPRRGVLPAFIGGVGIVITVTSGWSLLSNYAGLPSPPETFLTPTFIAASSLTAFFAAYSSVARGINYPLSSVLSAALGFFGPVTLPLAFSILPKWEEAVTPAAGGVVVGEVKGSLKGGLRRGAPVTLTFNVGEANHLVVLGSSGAGKTSVVKQLLQGAVSEGLNAVVIDFHGEYASGVCEEINAAEERLNPIALMGRSANTAAEEVSDSLARAFRLGSLQRAALHRILLNAYEFYGEEVTPHLLLDYIADPETPEAVGVGKEVVASLRPYIDSLAGKGVTWLKPEELLTGCKALNLSKIESPSMQDLIAEAIIRSVHYLRRASPDVTILVVEEAH